MPEYHCVKQRRPEEGAAAALVSVAQHHGFPVTVRGLSSLLGAASPQADLLYLLFAARKLGFEALPLEGDFDHLPEAPRPCIVAFGSAEQPEFAVLYEIDPESVLVGNTVTGAVERLDREAFCARWNGDIVQIVPDPGGVKAAQAAFAELRDPVAVIRRVLGLKPRSLGRLLFAPASAAAVVLAVVRHSFAAYAIGLCLILSLWSWAYSEVCSSCSRVKRAAGALPIAQVGAGLYAVLLALSALAPQDTLLLRLGLLTAAGVHLFLLGLLAHSRLLCWPCVVIATSVWTAGVLSASLGWHWLAVPGGLLLAALIMIPAHKLNEYQYRDTARRLATKVLAEAGSESVRVRMVVYVRKDCSACSFYETVLRPSLLEDFGDALSIEERVAGKEKILTPLYVIAGSINVLAGELPMEKAYDLLQTAIQAAIAPEESALKAAGGFYLIGFGS
jgi:hypothetical protein